MQPLFIRNQLKAIATLTLLVTSLATAALPPWTNSFFLTDDNTVFYSNQHDETFIKPDKLEEARLSKESRPAENDPEGNWGSVAEGFQLSLRFSKDTFMVGEPIIATIILRNTTQQMLRSYSISRDHDNELYVIDEKKNLVPSLILPPERGSAGALLVHEGSQRKFQRRLDQLFDLTTPGEYLIYTKRLIRKMSGNGNTRVVSGNATIRIVSAPKTAGQTNPGNTVTASSSSAVELANTGASTIYGKPPSANSQPSASAAAPKSAANTPKNILQPTPKTQTNKTPAQLAQAETGGGWSSRDWVFGLLVLGVVLGVGWVLFRARSPHPKR